MSVHCRYPHAKAVIGAMALGAISLGWTTGVRAEPCVLRIEGTPPLVQIDYDPFLPATAPGRITFRVKNISDAVCVADLAVVGPSRHPLTRVDMTTAGLKLELRPSQVITRSVLDAVFAMTLAPDEAVDASFDVAIVEDALVPSGRYSQQLMLELRQPGSDVAYEQAPVIIDLISLPRAQMNLSGSRGDFGTGASVSVVDFGEASTAKQRQVFIQTRANNAARLTFHSANKGRLILTGQEEGAPGLEYFAALEGHQLDLKQVSVRDIDPPRTFAGQAYELVLTLGKVEGAQAGSYNDELTIEISTL